MIKQVYAQAGKPGTSRAGFVAQWREHGGFAMTVPDYFDHVDGYIQADVLAAATHEAGGDATYYGVGELHFSGLSARDANFNAPSRASSIVPHGSAIFGHPRPMAFLCREQDLFHRRHGLVKVYAFFHANDQIAQHVFVDRWSESGQLTVTAMREESAGCAYVQSHPVNNQASFAGLDELSFDNLPAAMRFMAAGYTARIASQAKVTLLVTEQVVLYRRSNYA